LLQQHAEDLVLERHDQALDTLRQEAERLERVCTDGVSNVSQRISEEKRATEALVARVRDDGNKSVSLLRVSAVFYACLFMCV